MAGISRSDAVGDAREARNRLTDLVRERMDDTGNGLSRSEIDRNAARQSPLEKLVADAGPLGKFLVDRDDALPAGTSAFTVRSADTALRVAARTGIVTEPVLAGNPLLAPPPPDRVAQLGAADWRAVAAATPAQPIEPVARLAVTVLPVVLDTANRTATRPFDSPAVTPTETPPAPAAERAEPAVPQPAPVPSLAPAEVLSAQGLVDLLTSGQPIRSPHDAPPGAVLTYSSLNGGPGAVELRVPGGFARESIASDPLTGAALEGNGFRLTGIFVPAPAQPAAAMGR